MSLLTTAAVQIIVPDNAQVFALAPLVMSQGLQLVSNGKDVRLARVTPPGWFRITFPAPEPAAAVLEAA